MRLVKCVGIILIKLRAAKTINFGKFSNALSGFEQIEDFRVDTFENFLFTAC